MNTVRQLPQFVERVRRRDGKAGLKSALDTSAS
jgi:hypothetical protein